jgi:hypothetical protein
MADLPSWAMPNPSTGLSPPLSTAGGSSSLFGSYGGGVLGGLAGAGVGALIGQFLPPADVPYKGQLTGIAQTAGGQASQLSAEAQSFLTPAQGGPLPPALEAQVELATQDAETAMRSKYAQLGLSDSTMAGDVAGYIKLQAEALRGDLALKLANVGVSLTQSATQNLQIEQSAYTTLMNAQIAADKSQSDAVSGFVGALGMALAFA